MAKRTRKLWVGIGVATIAGAAATGDLGAQDPDTRRHAQPPPAQKGGARQARRRRRGLPDRRRPQGHAHPLLPRHRADARPSPGRPGADRARPVGRGAAAFPAPDRGALRAAWRSTSSCTTCSPSSASLQALAQAVKAKRRGAQEQALKVVEQRLDAALAIAKRYMTPVRSFTIRSAIEVLRTAQSEYRGLHGGRQVHEARGVPGQPGLRMAGGAHDRGRSGCIDAASLARVRAAFARLKTAWPAPMPPEKPILEVGEIVGPDLGDRARHLE